MASAAALRAKIAIKSWSLCFYCASANSKQLREFGNSRIPSKFRHCEALEKERAISFIKLY
ncbi:MAG: hypothetical protein SPE49_08060 [Campylobacter sp.]|uniref:hypothetical protein n=1 Tax=Campylobacter sp. TaxID=205 RepID=UPI002A819E56|nr:hypothetical protein [Campylobacter sp.]MCI7587041.1 hypothetical protein [Campylobacter sp.]MDY5115902.1 hypothetical protein [Campylobacter sp.]